MRRSLPVVGSALAMVLLAACGSGNPDTGLTCTLSAE